MPTTPGQHVWMPKLGKRPDEHFIPYRPHTAGGKRTLPPMSVAISILLPPYASNAQPPPVDAPGENAELYGFDVRPNKSDVVSNESRPAGTVVLTCTIAPASLRRRTIGAVVDTGLFALDENPMVVSCPAMSTTSLMLIGTPDRGWFGTYVESASSNIRSERQFVAVWAVRHFLAYALSTVLGTMRPLSHSSTSSASEKVSSFTSLSERGWS
jgi:hypothetical protein